MTIKYHTISLEFCLLASATLHAVSEFWLLDSWRLMKGPIGCPETSVINDYYSLRNSPEELGSHLLRGGGLKSCITTDSISCHYSTSSCLVLMKRVVWDATAWLVLSLWKVGNYSPKDTAPHLRRLKCLAITFDDLNSREVNCSLVIIGLPVTVWY